MEKKVSMIYSTTVLDQVAMFHCGTRDDNIMQMTQEEIMQQRQLHCKQVPTTINHNAMMNIIRRPRRSAWLSNETYLHSRFQETSARDAGKIGT